MAKRYVLFAAGGEVSDAGRRALSTALKKAYGEVKVIEVEGNPRMVIVRTTDEVARLLRNPAGCPQIGGERFVPVLTSGAVGKLKRRAQREGANGEVHERRVHQPGPGGAVGGPQVD